MNLFYELAKSILNGDSQKSVELCHELLDMGCDANEIIEKGLNRGMNMLSDMFDREEKFVPQILMSARAMNLCIEMLEPHICGNCVPLNGTVVIGTVEGDIHNIGKGLVSLMFQAACFKVIDLGTNVTKDEFIRAVKDNKASVVALSAMLTTAMLSMKDIVRELKCIETDKPLHIIVGGAPITERYAEEIDAVFAEDAIQAKDIAIRLMSNRRI